MLGGRSRSFKQKKSNHYLLQIIPKCVDLSRIQQYNPNRYPYLLQSFNCAEQRPCDILFAFPQQQLILNNSVCQLDKQKLAGNFFSNLDRHWQKQSCQKTDLPLLPFSGGWFLYLGYELAQHVEPKLKLENDPWLPTAMAIRVPCAIIFDRIVQQTVLVTEPAYQDELELMLADLESCVTVPEMKKEKLVQEIWEEPAEQYLSGIEEIKKYILAGDVFQVNLSRKWRAQLKDDTSAEQVYQNLRRSNPAPFAGIAHLPGATVISSSPERLLRRRGDMLETRPIAGTRPRGVETDTDQALARELLLHPKEQAEHVMLIDLERNDLGRVCQAGSVKVNQLMVLESYTHVHHIVSNIKGNVKTGLGPGTIIKAMFPGGTITGCPKVRCMEIIAELEGCHRGCYTGSMGYLNRDGGMDLNILIRSLVYRGGQVEFRAGAGIVYDSVPELELAETRAKAKGLQLAL